MEKNQMETKFVYDDNGINLPGAFVNGLIENAMCSGDIKTFEVCFDALNSDPERILKSGISVWMKWLEISESLVSKGEKPNKEIAQLLQAHHAGDSELLLQLYMRGGVETLLRVAEYSSININARDKDGLRILDRITLPTHLGTLFGRKVPLCEDKDAIKNLRDAGYRFGWAPRGYDTVWCRARKNKNEELPVYWYECIEDAKALGLKNDIKKRVRACYYEEYSTRYYVEDFVEYDKDYADDEFLKEQKFCLDNEGNLSNFCTLKELQERNGLLGWAKWGEQQCP